jgi:hypothetical protein
MLAAEIENAARAELRPQRPIKEEGHRVPLLRCHGDARSIGVSARRDRSLPFCPTPATVSGHRGSACYVPPTRGECIRPRQREASYRHDVRIWRRIAVSPRAGYRHISDTDYASVRARFDPTQTLRPSRPSERTIVSTRFPILSYERCGRGRIMRSRWVVENEDAAAARRYRERAREVRAIAAEAEDLGLRSALLRVARDYTRLALARLRIGKLGRSARTPRG